MAEGTAMNTTKMTTAFLACTMLLMSQPAFAAGMFGGGFGGGGVGHLAGGGGHFSGGGYEATHAKGSHHFWLFGHVQKQVQEVR
jgi:hypothetical protein